MIKSAGKFSRGYKGGRKSDSINLGPPSQRYVENADRMGWDKSPKFCACGRLSAWCECAHARLEKIIVDSATALYEAGADPDTCDRSDRAEPGEQQEHNG